MIYIQYGLFYSICCKLGNFDRSLEVRVFVVNYYYYSLCEQREQERIKQNVKGLVQSRLLMQRKDVMNVLISHNVSLQYLVTTVVYIYSPLRAVGC